MTLWTLVRVPLRPAARVTMLYGAAIVLFLAAAAIALQSLFGWQVEEDGRQYMRPVIGSAMGFRFNVQLDLLLATSILLLAWATVWPQAFRSPGPYLVLGVPVLLVAISPLLVPLQRFVAPPYSTVQWTSRTAAGPIAAAVVLLLWAYAARIKLTWPAFAVLKQARASRFTLLLAVSMFMSMLPWNSMLTIIYGRYLEVVRESIRTQSGVVQADRSLLVLHPRRVHDDYGVAYVSLLMHTAQSDGLVVQPQRERKLDWINPLTPPDIGKFTGPD